MILIYLTYLNSFVLALEVDGVDRVWLTAELIPKLWNVDVEWIILVDVNGVSCWEQDNYQLFSP